MGRRLLAILVSFFTFLIVLTAVNRTLGGLFLLLFGGSVPTGTMYIVARVVQVIVVLFSFAVAGGAAYRVWLWGRGQAA